MAYDSEHIYLTFGGTAPGGEIWQTGVRFAWSGDNPIAQGFMTFSMDDVMGHLRTWWANTECRWPHDHLLKWAKAARIGTDGKYAAEPRLVELVAGDPGSPSANLTAYQAMSTALVLSLRSGQTLGKANYGRMYLPSPAVSRDPGQPHIGNAIVYSVLHITGTMLEAVQGELDQLTSDARLSLFHQAVNPDNALHKPVTELRVGNILDTQRRRRNEPNELYEVRDFPIA